MIQKNPIKFLDSYTRDDLDIFFGREKETAELYEKVGKSRVVLLYGLSGTGKTSLINCGLENRYDADQRIFIYVRRGGNIINSFRQAIAQEASSLVHPQAGPAEALETLYYDFLKPVTIVFDQFEELFISGEYEEVQNFINTIAKILYSDLKVNFIFSLREEYLAHMDGFEGKIPIIYDHRHRLEKMRRSMLEEVIAKIAEKGGTRLENDQIPGMIIHNISDRKGNVELPYLQVYLDKLNRLMNEASPEKIYTKKLVDHAGELEDVLGDFLEEQIKNIGDKVGSAEVVNNILKQLITPDGTKKQLSFIEIKPYGNFRDEQLKDVLTKLEQSRIIKLDDGIYELSHDSLAKKIAEKWTSEELRLVEVIKFLRNATNSFKQTETLLDRKQLNYVKPYLNLLELSSDEKALLDKSRFRVRIRKISFWLLTGLALFILILWFTNIQQDKYRSHLDEAIGEMKAANYLQAKMSFQRALDVLYVLDRKEARDSITRCDELIRQEKPYKFHLRSGDSLFNLGVSQYGLAFKHYYDALESGYNNAEIKPLLESRIEAATVKYNELAEVEYDAGHRDIAFALISEAFMLGGDEGIRAQIDKWTNLAAKPDEFDDALSKLRETDFNNEDEKARANSLSRKYEEKREELDAK